MMTGLQPKTKSACISVQEVTCQYDGEKAVLVSGRDIYPHREDLYQKNFWRCPGCGAYVGCHMPNPRLGYEGTEPMGVLENADLRRAKNLAHAAFDPYWQLAGKTRKQAYQWLSVQMGLRFNECRIGLFSIEQCKQVVNIVYAAKKKDMMAHSRRDRGSKGNS